MSEDLRLKSV